MSSNCHQSHPNHESCDCACANTSVTQTLDELDFEKGIWQAAQYGDLERVKKLIRQVNDKDAAGYSALHYASRNGHVDVCRYLIDNGADIDAKTRAGEATALHRAAASGKTNIVQYLLSNGANINLQDADGKTALHRAYENGHKEICNILMNKAPELMKVADNKGSVVPPLDAVCN